MRFAYIDSQGAEVSIPSVDALALRIELGAIGPDTELYDAQADRWGPAHTHEIFHTLSRKSEGEGFVAPPPPVPPPGADEEPEPDAEPEAEVEPEPEPAEEEPEEIAAEVAEPAEAEGGDDDLGLDFTLTDSAVEAEEPAADMSFETESPEDTEGSPAVFDVSSELEAAPMAADEPDSDDDEDDSAFDFGDVGALELEAPEPAEAEEPAAPAEMSFEQPAEESEEPAMDFGGGLEMESDEPEAPSEAAGGLELETPMSEFSPDAPPAWMEQEGPGGEDEDEGTMDFSSPAATEEPSEPERVTDDEGRAKERPQPRSRPSPPKRRRKFPTGAVFGLLLLGGLGYGGWYGWGILQERLEARAAAAATPARPAVVIPDIPAELLPQMRDIGEAAIGDLIDELQDLQASLGLPVQPRDEWLAGIYLANASQYPDVEEYWFAIDSFVDTVRAVDASLFHEAYLARARRAGVDEETRGLLVERADSGFLATQDDRFEAYAQLDDLVNASLDLHQYLVDNGDRITYDPAVGGLSQDPLLEAVADDEAVSREMQSRMRRVAEALSALGTLDRVTTQRLSAVLYDRIRSAGFR